jgi:hypothetical protein
VRTFGRPHKWRWFDPLSSSLLFLSPHSIPFIDEVKAAVVTKLGVKKLIELMDAGSRMMPAGESVVQAAAQVLANIASKGINKLLICGREEKGERKITKS